MDKFTWKCFSLFFHYLSITLFIVLHTQTHTHIQAKLLPDWKCLLPFYHLDEQLSLSPIDLIELFVTFCYNPVFPLAQWMALIDCRISIFFVVRWYKDHYTNSFRPCFSFIPIFVYCICTINKIIYILHYYDIHNILTEMLL